MPINQVSPTWQRDNFGVTTQTENFSSDFIAGRSVVVGFNAYFGGHSWESGGQFTSVVIGGVTATLLLRQGDTADINHIVWYVAHNVQGNRRDVVLTIGGGSPSNYYTGGGFECDDLIEGAADSTGTTPNQTGSTTPSVSLTTVAAATRVVAGFSDRTGSDFLSTTPQGGSIAIWSNTSGNLHMSGAGAYRDESVAGAKTYSWTTGAAMDYIAAAVGLKITGMAAGNSGIGVDFINDTNNPRGTSAFDTTSEGVMIAAVGRGVLADFDTTNVTDNKGNGNYAQIGVKHAYTNWPSSGIAVYAKTGMIGGTGHVVQTSKPSLSDEVTILGLHVKGVNNVADSAWVEDLTSPNTSASVTLAGAGVLVAIWGGDNSSGELNPAIEAGWTKHQWTSSLASNHVQMAIASRVVPRGGTYTVTWTPTTSQGAQLWLIALQSSSSAPSFTTQPSTQTVANGSLVKLTAAASGATSYQWYSNESGSFAAISGQTSAEYQFTATSALSGKQYYVIASNASGDTQSNTVVVNVVGVPKMRTPYERLPRGGDDVFDQPQASVVLSNDVFDSVAATPGLVKVWVAGAWTEKPVKAWNGTSWVTKPLKRWNGSSWV